MRMERTDSSTLNRFGYDSDRHVLRLEFKNGGVYDYDGVAEEDWIGLKTAESKGFFVNTQIKPRYPARLLGRRTSQPD